MNKRIYIFLMLVFVSLLTASIIFLFGYHKESIEQNEIYDELVETVEIAKQNEDEEPLNYTEEQILIPQYTNLYKHNPDMVGWIKIEGTKINYPVMQSVRKPNFYLNHDFNGEYSKYGCPYVQENCDVFMPSDNIVIYGHNMKDGSMFAVLEKFKKKGFWEQHRKIIFDTLTDYREYEIVAIFKTVVYTDNADSFKYYQFTDAKEETDFNNYIKKCKALSLYETGVSAQYGDKLITLSTCERSQKNGRIVVVAKQIK